MPSSERRIAANRANALKSTGPRTAEGKEIARANALKHGLSSLVVVPGEEAGAVAARVEWLEDELAPEGDPLTLILARQVAFLSIQAERAFRYQSAMAAERARTAEEDFDEGRKAAADRLFGYIGAEPLTNHRRLMGTIQGCDLLIGRLEELRKVGAPGGPRWGEDHDTYIDLFFGRHIGAVPDSRGYALSKLMLYDNAAGLDPAEVPAGDRAARVAWAQAEMHKYLAAEVDRLRAHRATLDPARQAVGRAQAPDRAVLSFDKEAQLAHRYQFAALRTMQRAVDQIHRRRRELARKPSPPELAEARQEAAAMPGLPAMPVTLASFCRALEQPLPAGDASTFTIGKPPTAAAPAPPPAPPARHTP